MKKLDDLIIDYVQDAYLWLWDWTGVTVGACQFALFVCAVVLVNYNTNIATYTYVLIGVIGIISGWDAYIQIKHPYLFNAIARRLRKGMSIRTVLNILITINIIGYVTNGNVRGVFAECLWVCLSYLMTTQTRDREPKEFFKRSREVYQ